MQNDSAEDPKLIVDHIVELSKVMQDFMDQNPSPSTLNLIDHRHSVEGVVGLESILKNKVDLDYLRGYATLEHKHDIKDIGGLLDALQAKADGFKVSNLESSKADLDHSHVRSDITDLSVLIDDLRKALMPQLEFTYREEQGRLILAASVVSTHGYYTVPVVFQFMLRPKGTADWTMTAKHPFRMGILAYHHVTEILPPGEYEFMIDVSDYHNPSLDVSTGIKYITVTTNGGAEHAND